MRTRKWGARRRWQSWMPWCRTTARKRPLTLQPIRWDTPTHTPAYQVGHAHAHSSPSGGTRPFAPQSTAGTLPTPANQVGCALLRYSQQLGHSNSSQSASIRLFTLQQQLLSGTRPASQVRRILLSSLSVSHTNLHFFQSSGTRKLTLQPVIWDSSLTF